MNGFLADLNLISELTKDAPDHGYLRSLPSKASCGCSLSFFMSCIAQATSCIMVPIRAENRFR